MENLHTDKYTLQVLNQSKGFFIISNNKTRFKSKRYISPVRHEAYKCFTDTYGVKQELFNHLCKLELGESHAKSQ